MNRMRCKPADGKAWTTVRVRESRERLGIEPFDPAVPRIETVSADKAAERLGICVGSVQKLIREGVLPATQLMHSAPWQIPVDALGSDTVRTGVQAIVGRRPSNYRRMQDNVMLRGCPASDQEDAQCHKAPLLAPEHVQVARVRVAS